MGFWAGLILGTVSARFRDVPPIVARVMQVAFFLAPVFWVRGALGRRVLRALVTPFYYLPEVVRMPLLGKVPPADVWIAVIGMNCVAGVIAILFFARFRACSAYWVLRSSMPHIELDGVSVSFPIYSTGKRSLKKAVISATTGGRIGGDASHVVVQALDDVSFSFNQGDRVALLGHNGAGKTTMLRVLAGIFEPSSGAIRTEGKVTPMFDVGLGIDDDSTGFENIILRGLYLGMTKAEVARRLDDIVEFTALGNFLSLPVRTYSLGMRARPAFAIATCMEPRFCCSTRGSGQGMPISSRKRMCAFISSSRRPRSWCSPSHSVDLVCRLCNKALVLEHGRSSGAAIWTRG